MRRQKRRLLFGLLAGMLVVSGCAAGSKSDTSYNMSQEVYYDAGASFEAAAGEAAESGSTGAVLDAEAKIIRTCEVTLETEQFDETIRVLQTRTSSMGGYLESSSVYAHTRSRRQGYLTVRIPADRLDEWRSGVEELGVIVYSSESSRNVTLQYVDLESHISALRAEQEALLGMLEKAEKLEDILAIQSELTDVRYEIESYESQLRTMQDMVEYSTVDVTVNEVERESSQDSGFLGEAFGRLGDTLYELGQGARAFGIFVIGELPVLILLAIAAAAVILIVRAQRKKRRKRRACAADAPAARIDEHTVQVGEDPEKRKE